MPPSDISGTEKLARLRLIRTDNIGPMTYRRLINRYGSATRAIDALPDLAARGGKTGFTPCPAAVAEREMEDTAKFGATMIFHDEEKYPYLLAQIDDAPPVITVFGQTAVLDKPALGVVGARNASLNGRRIAETYAADIGRRGYTIVSGLARGIDTAAHVASLKTGTIAVVAGGIDVIYPRENQKLYADIAHHGAIIAESPFSTEPLARHFPRRNRIISGLSRGVLVVEAALKSGSLITARMALEQNRDVFAVPGSPLDPRAGGTNQLIADGAVIALSADIIVQHLESQRMRPLCEDAAPWESPPPVDRRPDEKLYDIVLENLGYAPVDIDSLIRATDAATGDILTILLEMEVAGRIARLHGNQVHLIG